MAVESSFNLFVPSTWQRFHLDDKVFQDYAAALLPRAIGYSAGLIDYFFAGYLNAVPLGWVQNATSVTLGSIASFIYPGAPRQPSGAGTIVLVLISSPPGSSNYTYYVSAPQSITIVPSDENDPDPNWVVAEMQFSTSLPSFYDSSVMWRSHVVWKGPMAELGAAEPIIVEQEGVFATPVGICCN
jgi:hypothetical protein